jgi:hypothetical protein
MFSCRRLLLRGRLPGRRRNCDVQVGDLAQGIELGSDLGFVADDDDGELRGVDVLIGNASDVGGGDLLDAAFVLVEEVGRIAVEGKDNLFVQRLLG